MTQDEIIEMARQAGMYQDLNVSFNQSIQNFAKLVADVIRCQERDHWKGIVDGQLRCITALNDIVGGEGSTTTKNILDYSRMEERIKEAVLEEREACAKTVETIETYEKIEKACFKFAAETIRARGEA
jgi:hypothetical protein